MTRECVVVKFHDKEKYAVAVRGGSTQECERYAAYCRGLYHEVPEVKFGVYAAAYYDMCVDMERQGGDDVYNTLATSDYTEHTETRVLTA